MARYSRILVERVLKKGGQPWRGMEGDGERWIGGGSLERKGWRWKERGVEIVSKGWPSPWRT